MYYDIKKCGKRIKKENGCTQESFAEKISITHRIYCGIESGVHNASIDEFVEMSKVLNV